MEKYDVDESGQLDFGEFLRLFWCVRTLRVTTKIPAAAS
jgi:hypothetical protein